MRSGTHTILARPKSVSNRRRMAAFPRSGSVTTWWFTASSAYSAIRPSRSAALKRSTQRRTTSTGADDPEGMGRPRPRPGLSGPTIMI
jgi:hypothetical protein